MPDRDGGGRPAAAPAPGARPRLTPVAPHRGAAVPLPDDGAPLWVGAAADAGLPLYLPGVGARHAAVVVRADGPWVLPQRAAAGGVRRNGAPLAEAAPLAHGDVLEFAPGVAYRLELGAPPGAAGDPAAGAPPAAAPPPPPPPRRSAGAAAAAAWHRWRRRPRGRATWRAWVAGTVAAALLVGAAAAVWRAARAGDDAAVRPLTEAEAAEYDAVVARAADHTERGAALLEAGAPEAALREFGAAVTALESSAVRDNPWVRPRVAALEAGIAAVYRERRVPVPARFARAGRSRAGAGEAGPALARPARLSADEFAARVGEVRRAFAARYGRTLVVTGGDHPEHRALYGPGGAVDLRVRDLSAEQVAFARDALRAAGVRVKDFSADPVLRAQVAAARAAGVPERAGTGLHLHADRFLDRRDAWTLPER